LGAVQEDAANSRDDVGTQNIHHPNATTGPRMSKYSAVGATCAIKEA